MNVTDDRQTTDGRAIAYSERERELNVCSRSLIKFYYLLRQISATIIKHG